MAQLSQLRSSYLVVSLQKGTQYRPQYTIVLIIGAPKKDTPNFGKPLFVCEQTKMSHNGPGALCCGIPLPERGHGEGPHHDPIKGFKFVRLMLVTLGFGPKDPF